MSSRLLQLFVGQDDAGYSIRNSRTDVLFECRQCGTKVDATTDRCPVCSSPGIARYEIS